MILHKPTPGLRKPKPFDRGGVDGGTVATPPNAKPMRVYPSSLWRDLVAALGFDPLPVTQADYALAGPKDAP